MSGLNGFAVKRYCACVRQKFKFIIASAKANVANFESYQKKSQSEWLLDEKLKKQGKYKLGLL